MSGNISPADMVGLRVVCGEFVEFGGDVIFAASVAEMTDKPALFDGLFAGNWIFRNQVRTAFFSHGSQTDGELLGQKHIDGTDTENPHTAKCQGCPSFTQSLSGYETLPDQLKRPDKGDNDRDQKEQ